MTEEQKTYGEKLLRTYHDWLYEHIMPPLADGYSASVMVLPWTNGEPDYRDTYRHGPQEFTGRGFFFYNVGPYAQCPELIVPGMYPNSLRRNYNPMNICVSPLSLASLCFFFPAVGTTPYDSKYTGRLEQLPAAVGIIAARGSDVMLADFVSDLFETGGSAMEFGGQQRAERRSSWWPWR